MSRLVILQKKTTFTWNNLNGDIPYELQYRFYLCSGFSYTSTDGDLVYRTPNSGNPYASGINVIMGEIIHE